MSEHMHKMSEITIGPEFYSDWLPFDSDCVRLEKYRIGFFEIIGVCDMEEGYEDIFRKKIRDRGNSIRENCGKGYRDIHYEKIFVLYETDVSDSYHGWFPIAFKPEEWDEYFSKLNLKKLKYGHQPVKIKFTSGPTIREAFHQDVQNDVKFLIGNMAKELISLLQADLNWWVKNLFDDLDIDGKWWRWTNGGHTIIPLKKRRPLVLVERCKDDYVPYEIEKMHANAAYCDPMKTARKIKWKRTKENSRSQRKRRRKCAKESKFSRKFRQNRLHARIQAVKDWN